MSIEEALKNAYQHGRADMLAEIISKCKRGFIDKITLEFMVEKEQKDGKET